MKKEVELEILRLVHQNYSFWAIRNHFKKLNVKVHDPQIARIKKKYSSDKENQPPRQHQRAKVGRPQKLSPFQAANLKKSVLAENPRPNNELADQYELHPSTISRYIKRNFKLVKGKKTKVHVLTDKEMERRYHRSLGLYRFLSANLTKIITTDEKIFQLPPNCGQSDSYYKKSRDRQRHFFIRRRQSFPKQVMVWGGISWNGKTQLLFI